LRRFWMMCVDRLVRATEFGLVFCVSGQLVRTHTKYQERRFKSGRPHQIEMRHSAV
jgi:hypothetical protein